MVEMDLRNPSEVKERKDAVLIRDVEWHDVM